MRYRIVLEIFITTKGGPKFVAFMKPERLTPCPKTRILSYYAPTTYISKANSNIIFTYFQIYKLLTSAEFYWPLCFVGRLMMLSVPRQYGVGW